jgi:hypothetical protein
MNNNCGVSKTCRAREAINSHGKNAGSVVLSNAAKLDAALQALTKDKESSAEGAKPGQEASAKQPRDRKPNSYS